MTGRRVVSVGSLRFGEDPFVVVAGPSPELPVEQLAVVAAMVAGTPTAMLRCGSTPLGLDQLVTVADDAKRAKLPSLGVVDSSSPFDAACDALDMVEVEVASLQDRDWLEVVRSSVLPIMLRRDSSSTVDDWLAAGDALSAAGRQVVLVSDGAGDGWLDTALGKSSLPVIVDAMSTDTEPSAAVLEARTNGAQGAMVTLTPGPNGPLNATSWSDLIFALEVLRTRGAIDRVDREIVRLLGERQRLSLEIGRAKADRGLPVFAPERERELMDGLRALGPSHGLRPDHLEAVFQLILAESRSTQEKRRSSDQ